MLLSCVMIMSSKPDDRSLIQHHNHYHHQHLKYSHLFMNFEELFGNFVTERVPRLAVSSIKLEDHEYDINTGIGDAGVNECW